MFPCNTELYMVCERRNERYPFPRPPTIKRIPLRAKAGSGVNNQIGGSFLGSKVPPSIPGGGSVSTNIGLGGAVSGLTPIRNDASYPLPLVPQNTISGTTGIGRPLSLPLEKSPFIQLHDRVAKIMKRRRLLHALAGHLID